jgi:hypothetical protein
MIVNIDKLIKQALIRQPVVKVLVGNVLLHPMGDGILRAELTDQPVYGAVWEALDLHGLGREVELRLGAVSYYYQAALGPDGKVYLTPSDSNTSLPDSEVFVKQAVNLLLPW